MSDQNRPHDSSNRHREITAPTAALQQAAQLPIEQAITVQKRVAQLFLNGVEVGNWAQRRNAELTTEMLDDYLATFERSTRNTAEGLEERRQSIQVSKQQAETDETDQSQSGLRVMPEPPLIGEGESIRVQLPSTDLASQQPEQPAGRQPAQTPVQPSQPQSQAPPDQAPPQQSQPQPQRPPQQTQLQPQPQHQSQSVPTFQSSLSQSPSLSTPRSPPELPQTQPQPQSQPYPQPESQPHSQLQTDPQPEPQSQSRQQEPEPQSPRPVSERPPQSPDQPGQQPTGQPAQRTASPQHSPEQTQLVSEEDINQQQSGQSDRQLRYLQDRQQRTQPQQEFAGTQSTAETNSDDTSQ